MYARGNIDNYCLKFIVYNDIRNMHIAHSVVHESQQVVRPGLATPSRPQLNFTSYNY